MTASPRPADHADLARKIVVQGSVVRGVYGLLALFAPKILIAATPGIRDEDYDKNARYFNRLFGGRELSIAVATVLAMRRTGAERPAVTVNVICELTDSVALVGELRDRRAFDRMTLIGTVFNLGGHVTWLRAAWALNRHGSIGPGGDPSRSAQPLDD